VQAGCDDLEMIGFALTRGRIGKLSSFSAKILVNDVTSFLEVHVIL
jgi:hypothetical protein